MQIEKEEFLKNREEELNDLGSSNSDLERRPHQAIQSAEEFIVNFLHEIENLNEDISEKVRTQFLELKKETQFLQKEIGQLRNLAQALIIANQPIPEIDKLNFTSVQKKELNTTYIDKKNTEEQKYFEKRIDQEMHETMYYVFSILKNNEYPIIGIGSNALVMYAKDKTSKKPKDLDVVAGIPDFPQAYAKAKQLAEKGKIKDLKINALTNLVDKKKNNCYEIAGYIVCKNGEEKSFSIFFQNIDPEKPNNGFINAGKEPNSADIYQATDPDGSPDTVDIPLATQDTNDVLYLKNALAELRLFNATYFEKMQEDCPFITMKSTQRLHNLWISNNYSHEEVIKMLNKGILKRHENEFIESKKFLEKLWTRYKVGGFEYANKDKEKFVGLTNRICEKQDIRLETKEACTEKAIDHITENIQKEMEEVDSLKKEALAYFFNAEQSNEKETINEALTNIDRIWGVLGSMHNKYAENLSLINNKDDHDFIPFVAIQSFERHFLSKVLGELYKYEDILKEKLKTI